MSHMDISSDEYSNNDVKLVVYFFHISHRNYEGCLALPSSRQILMGSMGGTPSRSSRATPNVTGGLVFGRYQCT